LKRISQVGSSIGINNGNYGNYGNNGNNGNNGYNLGKNKSQL